MEQTTLDNVILALLFASDEPLSGKKIASVIEDVSTADVGASIDRLTTRIRSETPSIVLEQVAGGWQLSTNAEYAEYVARLYSKRRKQRLSKAALETVAIIAYKQPITRAEIETIRGVGCGGVVTTLMERSLIKIVGKARVLGAPFLYGTTQEFLEYLGINSLKDLPSMEELEALLEKEESGAGEAEPQTASEQGDLGLGGASVEPFDGPGSESDEEKTGEEDDAWEAQSTPDEPPDGEDDPDRVPLDR